MPVVEDSKNKRVQMISHLLTNLGFAAVRAGTVLGRTQFDRYSHWICLKTLFDQLRINCVIDVGANQGQFARNLRRSGYYGPILSFEPNPEDFSELSRLSENDALWRTFNVALGNEDGERQLHVMKSTVFNSFLSPRGTNSSFFDPGMEIVGTQEVKVRRLDSIMEELLRPIGETRIMLKLDTQGFDLQAFRGTERCMDRVFALQSELSVSPIYEQMPDYLEALRYYESFGFSLMNLSVVNRTRQQSILEYDCLMARLGE